MSTQSARTRNASQATVNRYADRVAPAEDKPEPPKRVSLWWIPALMIGTWVELAYVVPALAAWFAQLP